MMGNAPSGSLPESVYASLDMSACSSYMSLPSFSCRVKMDKADKGLTCDRYRYWLSALSIKCRVHTARRKGTYYRTLIRTSSALGGATSTSSIVSGLAKCQLGQSWYQEDSPASQAIAALQVIVYSSAPSLSFSIWWSYFSLSWHCVGFGRNISDTLTVWKVESKDVIPVWFACVRLPPPPLFSSTWGLVNHAWCRLKHAFYSWTVGITAIGQDHHVC